MLRKKSLEPWNNSLEETPIITKIRIDKVVPLESFRTLFKILCTGPHGNYHCVNQELQVSHLWTLFMLVLVIFRFLLSIVL